MFEAVRFKIKNSSVDFRDVDMQLSKFYIQFRFYFRRIPIQVKY